MVTTVKYVSVDLPRYVALPNIWLSLLFTFAQQSYSTKLLAWVHVATCISHVYSPSGACLNNLCVHEWSRLCPRSLVCFWLIRSYTVPNILDTDINALPIECLSHACFSNFSLLCSPCVELAISTHTCMLDLERPNLSVLGWF